MTGTDPQVEISWSKDNGYSFSNPRTYVLGQKKRERPISLFRLEGGVQRSWVDLLIGFCGGLLIALLVWTVK